MADESTPTSESEKKIAASPVVAPNQTDLMLLRGRAQIIQEELMRDLDSAIETIAEKDIDRKKKETVLKGLAYAKQLLIEEMSTPVKTDRDESQIEDNMSAITRRLNSIIEHPYLGRMEKPDWGVFGFLQNFLEVIGFVDYNREEGQETRNIIGKMWQKMVGTPGEPGLAEEYKQIKENYIRVATQEPPSQAKTASEEPGKAFAEELKIKFDDETPDAEEVAASKEQNQEQPNSQQVAQTAEESSAEVITGDGVSDGPTPLKERVSKSQGSHADQQQLRKESRNTDVTVTW